jgi:hypothetical protein
MNLESSGRTLNGGATMRAELYHRAHHFADQIHHSIESAFFTAGALLLFLALVILYLGLLAVKP